MDTLNPDQQRTPASPEGRKEYSTPSLSILGRMQDLTASGTGGMTEHGHGATAIYSLV
jgi:hypothetical protein